MSISTLQTYRLPAFLMFFTGLDRGLRNEGLMMATTNLLTHHFYHPSTNDNTSQTPTHFFQSFNSSNISNNTLPIASSRCITSLCFIPKGSFIPIIIHHNQIVRDFIHDSHSFQCLPCLSFTLHISHFIIDQPRTRTH